MEASAAIDAAKHVLLACGVILAAGMAPWLLPLGFTLFHSVKSKAERFDAVLFLALWALVVFAFFSASGSKLPSYILPMFPPLALLIGR